MGSNCSRMAYLAISTHYYYLRVRSGPVVSIPVVSAIDDHGY